MAARDRFVPRRNETRCQVISAALAILCAADILDGLFNRRTDPLFVADMIGDAIKGFTFILTVVLMGCNRRQGLHTSGVLFIFWTVLTICEIMMYRSSFLELRRTDKDVDENRFIEEMIYFPFVVAQLVLSCFAEKRNRLSTYKSQNECPELSASFLSQLSFEWFTSMAYLGWKRPLIIGDLWQLNPDDRTESIITKFNRHCNYHQMQQRNYTELNGDDPNVTFSRSQNEHKVNIVPGLCKTFWAYFLVGAVCKGVYDLLQFANPMILKLIIDHVKSDDPLWKGILFAFLILGNGCLQSFILGHYFHRMFILGMRVRTALVSAIYRKSLVLSSKSRRESTVGEIVNLMSVDSQRFIDLMPYLNLLWSAPLQIVVAIVLLWKILGVSVLAGLFVMVILMPANALLSSKAKKFQVKQMKNKDDRVKLVNEVLSGIKVLKLYAWEEAFQKKVADIRDKEVDELRNMSYLNCVMVLLWNCSPFLVSLATFATYVVIDEKNILDATTAFVSLSLFNILRFPLTMLPNLITTMIMVSVSVTRINKYMGSEELTKYILHDSTQESALIIRNGNFSWSRDEKSVLRNINLSVSKGSLVAVVGQVGAGKSSLISAALGDMEKLQGTVSINGSTALVSQQPWIQNASLKDNILFSHALKQSKYLQIVDACSLSPDLSILPGGDETEIGEKGINLSGGQKQRVSLARAVYSDRDIYLLDDPLSAVDSHVGRHIFDNVIGPEGLLKEKTRILVTHSLTYLPQVDVIVVIKDGSVAEQGSFQQLIERKGPFAEFLSQYMQNVGPAEEDMEVLERIGNKNPELLRSLSEISSEAGHVSDTENRRTSSIRSVNRLPSWTSSLESSEVKNNKDKSTSKTDQLIQKEVAETGEVKFSVYMDYFRAVGWPWVASILVTYIIWQIFSVYSNVWLSEWGNDKPGPNNTQNITLRNMRLGVYGGLGAGQSFFIFLGSFATSYGTVMAANIIHRSLLQNVLRSPMSFFDTTPQGRIVNRFSKDIDTIDVTIPMTIRSWLSCLLQVMATLVVISIQTPLFLAIILPVGGLYYVIQKFYVATSRQLKRLESITRSPIYSHFSETLSGTSTIRSFDSEERFSRHSDSLVDKNQVCYYPSIVSNRWLAIRLDFCGNNMIFFAALFAVLGRGTLEPGEVGLSVSYALMVTSTLNWLVRMSSELETNIVAVERVIEYTKTETEAEWVLPHNKMPKNWPLKGNVQMDNYSTRYREGLDLVLKGISCDIFPSEKVGIVGRTGAGKSSLTLSLFRIIEAAGGCIKIDGITISCLGLHDLRSRITIIPQDPVLFSGTLRMNLDPFNWYTDTHVWEALEHAHLKEFVSSLPQGLMHEIVEGGENLSVGQRQLVCLARALLRKTKILVLDEATAAVDLETDDLIQATIRREFSDSTVLTIAHRLNTVMDYDRIMVLDNGNVAEFDSPVKLLANKRSIFYGMANDAGLV